MKSLETLMLWLGPLLTVAGMGLALLAWLKPDALRTGFFKPYFPVQDHDLRKVYLAQAWQTSSIGIWLVLSALNWRTPMYVAIASVLLSSFWLMKLNRMARLKAQT